MKPKVFIGSSGRAFETAKLVKAELATCAEAYHWQDKIFGLGLTTFESLLNALTQFDFAVLLFTPDDSIVHAGRSTFKPRDNVLIEFGLFTGGLGRDRTFIMMPFHESLHIPTDLAGVTVAELKQSNSARQTYDVKDGCKAIADAINSAGFRVHSSEELGVLYRMINALTFPYYQGNYAPMLEKAKAAPEFKMVRDVVDFLAELFTDYVFPHLNPGQLESMRIYFAYYLGDGITDSPWNENVQACWDRNSSNDEFPGEFVIGLANPTGLTAEPDWRIGRAIPGFIHMVPQSICANAFERGKLVGYEDVRKRTVGLDNYETPGELSVFSFPVEWRSEHGKGRIGVFTISSQKVDSISPKLQTLIDLLSNVIGFLFSLYAVGSRAALEARGSLPNLPSSTRGFSNISDTEEGRRFAAAVIGLRREIAGYFETHMKIHNRHQLRDKNLWCSADQSGGSGQGAGK